MTNNTSDQDPTLDTITRITAPLCQELWQLFPPGDCVVVLAGVKAEPFGWLRQP
jgi:hypothetical protein